MDRKTLEQLINSDTDGLLDIPADSDVAADGWTWGEVRAMAGAMTTSAPGKLDGSGEPGVSYYRDLILSGAVLDVELHDGETVSKVYQLNDLSSEDHGMLVHDVREGWCAGIVEAICAPESEYLDREFMRGATTVTINGEAA